MPWSKSDDGAATHPVVLAPAASGDPRLVNELYGFIHRLVLLCAKDLTDYHVNFGMAYLCAPHDPLGMMALAVQWNYAEVVGDSGQEWRLIEHQGMHHNRTKAEIEWEKAQRADARDPVLVAAVLFRDGDACRCCRVITNRKARRGDRQAVLANLREVASMEHVNPGEPAQSPDDLANLCYSCNSARRDRANADQLRPLLPVPTRPFYTEYTASLLREAGFNVKASSESRRPKRVPFPSKSDPAPSGTTPDSATTQRPANAAENAEQPTSAERPATQADTAAQAVPGPLASPPEAPTVPNLGPPGRDGNGQAGAGTGSRRTQGTSSQSVQRKRKPRGNNRSKEKP